jgi:hypothetical protein
MFRKTLIGLLLALSVSWSLLGAAMQWFYYYDLPKNPDNSTGRTNQVIVNHGSVRFGTENQARTLRLMQNGLPVAALLFVVALFVGLKLGVLHVRGKGTTGNGSPDHPAHEA